MLKFISFKKNINLNRFISSLIILSFFVNPLLLYSDYNDSWQEQEYTNNEIENQYWEQYKNKDNTQQPYWELKNQFQDTAETNWPELTRREAARINNERAIKKIMRPIAALTTNSSDDEIALAVLKVKKELQKKLHIRISIKKLAKNIVKKFEKEKKGFKKAEFKAFVKKIENMAANPKKAYYIDSNTQNYQLEKGVMSPNNRSEADAHIAIGWAEMLAGGLLAAAAGYVGMGPLAYTGLSVLFHGFYMVAHGSYSCSDFNKKIK